MKQDMHGLIYLQVSCHDAKVSLNLCCRFSLLLTPSPREKSNHDSVTFYIKGLKYISSNEEKIQEEKCEAPAFQFWLAMCSSRPK